MLSSHAVEYYSAFRKKEIVSFVACLELEKITLSEINQSQEVKYCRFHLHDLTRVVKLIEAETRMVLARDGKKGNDVPWV